jgi:hypothetical protein
MEIEMRAVIFYYCRHGKGEKKIHPNYPTCSASTHIHIHWVREFKAQRTDIHDEIRPGRPLIDVSAQSARLLNDELFGSTRYLAPQLAVTQEAVKRNLQEVLGFHKFNLKSVPNVFSAEQRQQEYKYRASSITISFSNDRKISPQSSSGRELI